MRLRNIAFSIFNMCSQSLSNSTITQISDHEHKKELSRIELNLYKALNITALIRNQLTEEKPEHVSLHAVYDMLETAITDLSSINKGA